MLAFGKRDAIECDFTIIRTTAFKARAIDEVFLSVCPPECQRSAIRAHKAKTRSDAGSFIAAKGSHLTAIDDDVAAPPPRRITASSSIATSTADAGSPTSTLGCHHATVDNNGAAIFITFAASDASRMCTAVGGDGASVDDDGAYIRCTDARLALIASFNFQCTRAVDGQAIAFAHLDAFQSTEDSSFAEVQLGSATDLDARGEGYVGTGIYYKRRRATN